MADAKPGAVQQQVEMSRSPNFVKVYANAANIEVSLWDFKLIFGEIQKATETKLSIENSVLIITSPQHAKVLAAVLAENIKKYESAFGEIRTELRTPDAKRTAPTEQNQSR